MQERNYPIILVDISFFLAKMINADVHGGLPDERRETAGFLQFSRAQFSQGGDEGVLAKVVGKLEAAGALEQDQLDTAGIALDKLRFSIPVTGFYPVNEFARLFS